ncbi:PorP/SprF family type IX secretion system membrane protein [Mongoliitalea daihaiensis]|uniref:PorP/SprF family type IX secretion system membrane protein n=1 Tax=Mongoliitalea daihaiensis TaxID=2782006 RepID=UPI001F170113|nr:type IX secretion system membrane protein PorP/SprF [Mongoliitalea daihaiensis]UJP64971.1 type IX secretion system membrane protein PorP/SprF [Mongoliitalea daihaiensis]
MKKLIFLILFVTMAIEVKGQDVQFTQFYAAPVYLNPAFTGASELTRVGANFRNQWPGLDHSFVSYSAYIDHYMFDINSGVGLIFNANRESKSRLATNEIGLTYSYRLQLGNDAFLRVGGQVSHIGRDAYFGDLIFGSQLDINAGTIGTDSGELLSEDYRHNFLNYNLGFLFNSERVWFGVSGHNLTQPNISFIDDNISRLPIRLSAHGGIKVDLGEGYINNFYSNARQERAAMFAFNYKHQAPFNQLDIGTQIFIQPLVLGVWYRGFPVKYAMPNNESIAALIGITLESGLDIGYSYDFTISKLGNLQSAGAHEISIRYSFLYGDPNQRNRRSTIIPCFRF